VAHNIEIGSNPALPALRRRAIWLVAGAWSVTVLALVVWWSQDRLQGHRAQSAATGAVRLNGVRDALTLSLGQLAALPLDLSHHDAVAGFLAGAAGEVPGIELQRMLDRFGADFALPLVALVDRDGRMRATTRSGPRGPGNAAPPDVTARPYFADAMDRGAAIQFLVGPGTGVPGLFFSARVEHGGAPVGVALVKQDTATLNRLLRDAGGARVFVTDHHGVVVLSNQQDMLLKRLPDAPELIEAVAEATYRRMPEILAWMQAQLGEGAAATLVTRIGEVRHATLSTPLGDTPLKLWVLEPFDEEPRIARSAWTGGTALWAVGCLLIWLSWRRVQSLDAALRARRDIFELAQALPLTVFRYHRSADGAGRFAFVGRGVEGLFGVPAEQLDRDPTLPWRLAGSDDRPPTDPQEFRVENGETAAWVLADSAPLREADGSTTYNGYWLDITARREAQARFAAVFEHASTAYLFFDPRRGVTHCNPAALGLFGATDAPALLGRALWFPGLSPERQADGRPSRERALDDLREHTRTGQRVRTFEWCFRRLDGRLFDAEVHVIALDWVGAAEFCAVVQDITERKQMQAATERAREAAEAASQTKSRFLANMSHELRTPMNAIIGMTHLALEDGLPARQRGYVEKAHTSARNLLQILNDILDLSKIEAGQMTLERIDFALESVIDDMADVLALKAEEKGLELLFSAAPNLPPRLVGDPTRLRQVLVNLGSNAIKFTDAGEVTVGMEVAQLGVDSVELHAWVRDTGVGLSEAATARLFQPFVQADSSTTRRHGGTGLGLVISRQLVERMGGRLWVESEPGRGSTFHFTARFGRSAPRAPVQAWSADDLRGRRALLVDDNAAAREVLGNMLEALGVDVDRVDSGAQALARVDAAPGAYTWFLIDWKMPGMDGVECARRILDAHPQARPCILLVTAFARDDALRASAGLALAGVLQKPVTPSSLHDSLVRAHGAEPAPARAPARRDDATPLARAARQRLAGARILLAEDHPINQELAGELLRRAGMEVVVAKDGREALDTLAREGPFDGILMDCQMPVMDGYTATRELRRHPQWRQLPVIAMTASALAEDRERALAAGMNDHITKPIHIESMLRTMAQWISGPAGRRGAEAPAPPPAAPAPADDAALDTAVGLSYCMGSEALYHRLLAGFRSDEAGFAAAVGTALAEQRWDDALRRTHDLRSLAGTLGARPLLAAAQALHVAIGAHQATRGGDELRRVQAELDRVLERIAALLAPP
jgi:PAS domain S-box-containing protein